MGLHRKEKGATAEVRIVFGTSLFYPYFGIGGVVRAFNTARWLAKFGHEVTVLCAKTSPYSIEIDCSLPSYEEVECIRIVRSKHIYKYGASISSLPSLLDQYLELRRMIGNNEVDIINTLTYRSCIPLVVAAMGRVPCIATIHAIVLSGGLFGLGGWKSYQAGTLSAIRGYLMENVMLHLPYDGLMVTAEWMGNEVAKYYPNRPIKVIYGGVDLEQVDSVACESKDPNQIVFMGSLIKHKNILDAIDATRLATRRMKGLKLAIISAGGEYERMIESLCKANGAFKYYRNPSRKEIFRILKESSLLIHPSRSETFGITVAEALACGTPFVAYDVPSMKEILQRMQGGELVPYGNCTALGQKICELLSDKNRIAELAKLGRSIVEREFTWEKTARRVEKAFEEFLHGFQGGRTDA